MVGLLLSKRTAEPEVGEFELPVAVEEQVVGLDIPVRETQPMHCFETVNQASEVEASHIFGKRASF